MTDREKVEAVKEEMDLFNGKVKRVALLRTRLAELEDDINNPSLSSSMSSTRGSGISAGAARLVLIKAEVEEQLKLATNDYTGELATIFRRMRKLPVTDRIILEHRYLYDTPVADIMRELNISKSTYYEKHDNACVSYYDKE